MNCLWSPRVQFLSIFVTLAVAGCIVIIVGAATGNVFAVILAMVIVAMATYEVMRPFDATRTSPVQQSPNDQRHRSMMYEATKQAHLGSAKMPLVDTTMQTSLAREYLSTLARLNVLQQELISSIELEGADLEAPVGSPS
eukprot:GEMP01062315.1.p1 GENE.GEMP01062315.1~~GEMP01062315.1.p1  ORF type:complete len:163 (+),score=28.75 GEMP01062315.1:71-490(+)